MGEVADRFCAVGGRITEFDGIQHLDVRFRVPDGRSRQICAPDKRIDCGHGVGLAVSRRTHVCVLRSEPGAKQIEPMPLQKAVHLIPGQGDHCFTVAAICPRDTAAACMEKHAGQLPNCFPAHRYLCGSPSVDQRIFAARDCINKNAPAFGDAARQAVNDTQTQDIADMALASYTKEFMFGKSSVDHQILRMIQQALKRIQDRSYGVCADCEQEIEFKRLEAVPWAPHCVHCQARMEKRQVKDQNKPLPLD